MLLSHAGGLLISKGGRMSVEQSAKEYLKLWEEAKELRAALAKAEQRIAELENQLALIREEAANWCTADFARELIQALSEARVAIREVPPGGTRFFRWQEKHAPTIKAAREAQ
jgi:prefoldin subunit 5